MHQYADIQSAIISLLQIPELQLQNDVSQQNVSNSIDSSDFLSNNSSWNEQRVTRKDIYVCTFCQVFSPHLATVANHILINHSESLPEGTKPENFVSKLQQLEDSLENSQKKKGKIGRPRKKPDERTISVKSKEKIVDPVPDSKGLFWCKTCLRYFRKSRQLIQHICHDPEGEISSEESSSAELDEDVEFRTHMNIDPVPWSRSKKIRKLKENSTDIDSSSSKAIKVSSVESNNNTNENKVISNWRNDPNYIPLFDDKEEKAAFEEHLKSIDYSYVDALFQVEEKQCRNKRKNSSVNTQSVVYFCNVCKKDFKSLSSIRPHCLTHTDLKPFTCPKCSYSSNSAGSLYMHMRIHTGNVFRCSFCNFKCMKRSHLLDHEATHSTVYQTCKLCKNSYKTVKSLVAHVRKYHNYSGGKKYMKSLTSKQSKCFKCDICNKKFKSLDILNNHNHACHEIFPTPNGTLTDESPSVENSEKINLNDDKMETQSSSANNVELSVSDLRCNGMQAKDPLAEIVLNDFFQQQQQSRAIMYQGVFNHTGENIISSPNNNLLEGFQANAMAERLTTESSILEECQKTLDIDILKECLQNSGFSNECQKFNLIPNISRKHSLRSNNSENDPDVASHLNEISGDKLEEPKSVEIKLFEKCQRAPAYVCCVCSSIYICPSTLKAHLREHVNNTISSFMDQAEEQFEPTKITEANNELDVCQILQDSSESFSFDKELEKLYTSSLDMMYYLPEVSVVLENDSALFDSVLDDLSNFPISDNSSESLNGKNEEENVLKCFPEM